MIPLAPYRNTETALHHLKLEGFRVGIAKCRHCQHEWTVALIPDARSWDLECSECKQKDSEFTSK